MIQIMMRCLAALVLLAVSARCQSAKLLIYSSDLFGHYVPYNESLYDCPLKSASRRAPFPLTMQLEGEEDGLLTMEEEIVEQWLPWGDCGVGGVPRLVGQLSTFPEELTLVTGGNILGDGDWELPANVSAAALAAVQFDVMGLGPGEFLRGTPFLREFLTTINDSAPTTVIACNVQSGLLGDLIKPYVITNGTLFVGVVDPAVVPDFVTLDTDLQLSNTSCVQDIINKQSKNNTIPAVVVGSAASLDSSIFDATGVTAFVISGLPKQDKQKALMAQDQKANKTTLVTDGYGSTIGIFNMTNPAAAPNVTTLNGDAPEDSGTANTTAQLQQAVADFYATRVTSYYELTSDKCDGTECSLGDVICDAALIGALLDGRITPRPIAVWPGQNLTGKIPKGSLTVSQLYATIPDEQVALANASGETVIKLFSRAVEDMTVDASSSKTFLQVSGVRVTYDLDLAQPYRAKYLMNLCLNCTPQEYLPISKSWNYTVALPVSMVDHPYWKDITDQFTGLLVTGFSARDAISAKAQVTGRILSPVGDRIDFTHIAPDVDPTDDTFIAVLSTVIVCMVVFGLGLFGFNVWSRRQNQFGSTTALLR
ncbi:snake venom 5'-nucleotidase-like [Amphibalanus amphitrite]|uniref:snake venom 5'-nucleotidase-like n=1 Tax=Amphibalanus amphitrite TaxID=1232801 RepID=UPI001C920D9F|nr:snake venom 5'-nucleotidase-like [Amphibalanus amphitrite]